MDEGLTYRDKRIAETFQIIRDMGVELVIGKQARQPRIPRLPPSPTRPIPARNILLDLSVLVALCCDSAHHPLPSNSEELEARFRPILPPGTTSESGSNDAHLHLTPHSNVTKDLRDQLQWEVQHSLIDEMQTQLAKTLLRDGASVQFWVTEEVKGRLPNIIDIIGGPHEKARAKALFQEEGGTEDFWHESRWKGKAPALGGLRLQILNDEDEDDNDSLSDLSDLKLEDGKIPSFNKRLVHACRNLLTLPESGSISHPAPLHRQKYRRSRHFKRPHVIFPTTRLPSQHTLNSFAAGAKRGWTVLTNNRGAVGKVVRDMGVKDGLPFEDEGEGDGRAVIWVVNPSSLSEWRRLEVEESNRKLREPKAGNQNGTL
jgi:hypothetical protein